MNGQNLNNRLPPPQHLSNPGLLSAEFQSQEEKGKNNNNPFTTNMAQPPPAITSSFSLQQSGLENVIPNSSFVGPSSQTQNPDLLLPSISQIVPDLRLREGVSPNRFDTQYGLPGANSVNPLNYRFSNDKSGKEEQYFSNTTRRMNDPRDVWSKYSFPKDNCENDAAEDCDSLPQPLEPDLTSFQINQGFLSNNTQIMQAAPSACGLDGFTSPLTTRSATDLSMYSLSSYHPQKNKVSADIPNSFRKRKRTNSQDLTTDAENPRKRPCIITRDEPQRTETVTQPQIQEIGVENTLKSQSTPWEPFASANNESVVAPVTVFSKTNTAFGQITMEYPPNTVNSSVILNQAHLNGSSQLLQPIPPKKSADDEEDGKPHYFFPPLNNIPYVPAERPSQSSNPLQNSEKSDLDSPHARKPIVYKFVDSNPEAMRLKKEARGGQKRAPSERIQKKKKEQK